ncbi:lipopolysaccharide biosynthesis protein [Cereibacter sphaeroides]|uniref:lipopolysaccharide biosynthesis protein n=1 Tax=Rhodobacterales TaxID=204455 RepID=UPI000BBE8BF0|nr:MULTISPECIES: lipopolysaccharide biosynthesis protein [Paracoccaceae]MCE6960735.1 lipopolysaccharide biosynthesis protein [Cereibacter sphaeroides]MCE6969999.1 lipopolysaccharide biosynthesis protein [Cereibacter sphaeroides]MCE6974387.1 lipopolysaccharide biosynthesis protein [Cereibacter sphaeroides]
MTSESSAFDPPEGALRATASRGAVATVASQAALMLTQIGSVVILSRLLSPEDFGLVAMCSPVIALLMMLQEFGLLAATVQKQGLRNEEVNFLFWVNVALSLSLTVLLLLAAPLVAMFYQEPRVAPLIAALSVTIALNGLGAQHGALLIRRMQYVRLGFIQVAGAVSALAAAAIWGWIDPSPWALFGGALVGTLVPTAGMWLGSRWRPGLPRLIEGWRPLMGFGAGITGFNFANFFSMNLDKVVIGRAFGGEALGYYDRAFKLVLMPANSIFNPLARVMVPALSRLQDEPGRYRSAYLRVVGLVLLLILPMMACAAAFADIVIPLAFGGNWEGSVAIFTALGIAGLVQPLNNVAGWLFISQGRSRDFFHSGLIHAAFVAAAVLAGLPFGLIGVVVAVAAAEYLKVPAIWLLTCRSGPVGIRDMLRGVGPMIVAAHLVLGLLWVIKPTLPEPGLLALAIGGLLSYLLTAAMIAVSPSGRETLREAWRFAAERLPLRRRAASGA